MGCPKFANLLRVRSSQQKPKTRSGRPPTYGKEKHLPLKRVLIRKIIKIKSRKRLSYTKGRIRGWNRFRVSPGQLTLRPWRN